MNLQERYNQEYIVKLKQELGMANVMSVPKVKKVVLNVGVKEALTDKKVLDAVSEQLSAITGQKPTVRLAKKSIAAFKLREGQAVGVSVTLRGKRMYDFLEKLISIVFPRVRDFRGVSENSFDRQGNYSIGFSEQIVFPEIDYSKIDKIRGLQVTISTTARNASEGKALLKMLGMPFSKA